MNGKGFIPLHERSPHQPHKHSHITNRREELCFTNRFVTDLHKIIVQTILHFVTLQNVHPLLKEWLNLEDPTPHPHHQQSLVLVLRHAQIHANRNLIRQHTEIEPVSALHPTPHATSSLSTNRTGNWQTSARSQPR